MILSDVVMGKTKKLTVSDPSLTAVCCGPTLRLYSRDLTSVQPPAGYDSVVGEPGGDLNYDEAVGTLSPLP